MAYDPGHFRQRARHISTAYDLGLKGVTGLTGVGVLTSELKRILENSPTLTSYLYLGLLASTLLLIAGWLIYSKQELDQLCDFLDPKEYVPPDDRIIIFAFAMVLVLLVFTSRDPVLFGSVFVVYSVSILFATKHLKAELATAFAKSRERLVAEKVDPEFSDVYKQAIGVLSDHYLARPQTPRHSVILLLGTVGLALSLYGRYSGLRIYDAGAYVIYIASILGSEFVMFAWRHARDQRLRPLVAQLEEQQRARMQAAH